LIEYLCANWANGVDLYSVNVPLEPGVSENKVLYTNMLDNRWSSGSCFQAAEPTSADNPELQEKQLRSEGEVTGKTPDQSVSTSEESSTGPSIKHKHFTWAPSFQDVYRSVEESEPGNDGWVVKEQMTRFVEPSHTMYYQLTIAVSHLSRPISCIPPDSLGRSNCEWIFSAR
jgi:broad specificity polyphosphatase/5'/3'-nucleotidase SurE